MIGFSELIISGGKKVTKVELFEVIRKEHFNQGKSIRSRARSSKLINWKGSTTRRKRDQIADSLNSKGAAKWMQV